MLWSDNINIKSYAWLYNPNIANLMIDFLYEYKCCN